MDEKILIVGNDAQTEALLSQVLSDSDFQVLIISGIGSCRRARRALVSFAAKTLWMIVCQVRTAAKFSIALKSTYSHPIVGLMNGLNPPAP